MKKKARVALIIETSGGYGRQIISGISRYLKTHGGWSVFTDEGEGIQPLPEWLVGWDGDGIICRGTTPALAQVLRASNFDVVDLNDNVGGLGLPRVSSDMAAIGRMAAEHLLERGYRTIAYAGFTNLWSRARLTGVREALHGKGTLHSVFETVSNGYRTKNWECEIEQLCQWIQILPRPIGIVACNDRRGQHVLAACSIIGVSVPDEVAVIGVDNSEALCELCDPPLSSVMPDAERIGFEAAVLLSKLMRREEPMEASETILIPPQGVVPRRSTEAWAVEDPIVARSLHYIREHACDGIAVNDVLMHVRVSRSTLERLFRHHLGHSPQEEIRHVRLKRIKQLLVDTDLSLPQIAEITGFKHPEYLIAQFKRLTGETTSGWRKSHRS